MGNGNGGKLEHTAVPMWYKISGEMGMTVTRGVRPSESLSPCGTDPSPKSNLTFFVR